MLPQMTASARHSISRLMQRRIPLQSEPSRPHCSLPIAAKARWSVRQKDVLGSAFLTRRFGNVSAISSQGQQQQRSRTRYYAIGTGVAVALLFVGQRYDFLQRPQQERREITTQNTETRSSCGSNTSLKASGKLPDIKRSIYPVLDLNGANAKLKASEQSYNTSSDDTAEGSLVSRFDILRLPSNSPCEDEFAFDTVDVGQERAWQFWGVYDGHAGWATSALLRSSLIAYVGRGIKDLITTQGGEATSEAVDAAITSSFLRLDGEIMDDALRAMDDSNTHGEAVSITAPARAGSCALLAIHDPIKSTLKVACVGDSRAVLGRRHSSGTDDNSWTTIELSSDQTGFNPDECARLNEAHPGEPNIIDTQSGRLLGIAVTRAFGDHRWKWSSEAIERFRDKFFGVGPRPHYLTPPYMTAEPVITTTQVQKGDFVILASDGFWDRMTNEDAVRCVMKWINRDSPSKDVATRNGAHNSQMVGFPEEKVSPETFVVEDENVATHLVRNALGGNRREHFCGELSLQSPDSRYERDDITVQVIFFGDVGRKEEVRT